jgi:hypothetical protein
MSTITAAAVTAAETDHATAKASVDAAAVAVTAAAAAYAADPSATNAKAYRAAKDAAELGALALDGAASRLASARAQHQAAEHETALDRTRSDLVPARAAHAAARARLDAARETRAGVDVLRTLPAILDAAGEQEARAQGEQEAAELGEQEARAALDAVASRLAELDPGFAAELQEARAQGEQEARAGELAALTLDGFRAELAAPIAAVVAARGVLFAALRALYASARAHEGRAQRAGVDLVHKDPVRLARALLNFAVHEAHEPDLDGAAPITIGRILTRTADRAQMYEGAADALEIPAGRGVARLSGEERIRLFLAGRASEIERASRAAEIEADFAGVTAWDEGAPDPVVRARGAARELRWCQRSGRWKGDRTARVATIEAAIAKGVETLVAYFTANPRARSYSVAGAYLVQTPAGQDFNGPGGMQRRIAAMLEIDASRVPAMAPPPPPLPSAPHAPADLGALG